MAQTKGESPRTSNSLRDINLYKVVASVQSRIFKLAQKNKKNLYELFFLSAFGEF